MTAFMVLELAVRARFAARINLVLKTTKDTLNQRNGDVCACARPWVTAAQFIIGSHTQEFPKMWGTKIDVYGQVSR
jgi:hypothetical protein